MQLLKHIDAALEKAAAALVEPPRRRVMKIALYFALVGVLIWIPYSLVRHVYTSGFYLVSVEREERVGNKVAARLKDELNLESQSDPVERYVEEVGDRISRANNPWQENFGFSVVRDDRTVNAFAIPGGRIYITTGLLNRLDNEAELAAVLSHEVAHVTCRHYARNMGRQMLMSWVKKFLGSTDRTILNTGSFLTANLTLLRMRQGDELDADYQGTLYMYDLDYDPAASVSVMKKLLSIEKKMPDFIQMMALTHPPSRERLDAMIVLNDSLPNKDNLTLGTERYQRIVKGVQPGKEPSPNVLPAPFAQSDF